MYVACESWDIADQRLSSGRRGRRGWREGRLGYRGGKKDREGAGEIWGGGRRRGFGAGGGRGDWGDLGGGKGV